MTKNQTIDTLKQAILCNIKEFGENYVQESILKIESLKKYKNIVWHFIGKIQSNKIKKIAYNFHWCQTIEKEKNAILLNKFRPEYFPPLNVLIQINISKEKNKNGSDINNYLYLAECISSLPKLNLRGIMSMPSRHENTISNSIQYKKITNIFEILKEKYISVDTLSLGTSFDIKSSLIAGSNMLRLGRNIFNK